jgi:hypothetical protein
VKAIKAYNVLATSVPHCQIAAVNTPDCASTASQARPYLLPTSSFYSIELSKLFYSFPKLSDLFLFTAKLQSA